MRSLLLPALLVLVPLALALGSYNRFMAQLASIDATWANIDTQLQRRHDLVPSLVTTVQAYAAHERSIIDAVTEARSRAMAAVPRGPSVDQQARAEDALTQRLTSLLAVTEAYPQLRADAGFRALQRALVEAEDRIAAARRLYNLEVAAYERRRRSVPSNLVAGAAELGPRRSFEIVDPVAAHAVRISDPGRRPPPDEPRWRRPPRPRTGPGRR